MGQLKSIWNLEKYNSKLDSLWSELEDLKEKSKQEKIKKDYKKLNDKLDILDNNGEIIKSAILKYENSLAQYEFNMEKLNDKLYKDNITDIKQLEHLSEEKKQLESKIKEIEIEMLAYMEEEEIIKEKYKNNLSRKDSLEGKLEDEKNVLESEIEILTSDIRELETLKNQLLEKVDGSLLEEYRYIRERKARPVALVEGNICQGCNMKLPLYQIQDLDQDDKIINCESCGRILYKEK